MIRSLSRSFLDLLNEKSLRIAFVPLSIDRKLKLFQLSHQTVQDGMPAIKDAKKSDQREHNVQLELFPTIHVIALAF